MSNKIFTYVLFYLQQRHEKPVALNLCEGNSPMTDDFPAQRASNPEMFPFADVIMVIFNPDATTIASVIYRYDFVSTHILLQYITIH